MRTMIGTIAWPLAVILLTPPTSEAGRPSISIMTQEARRVPSALLAR
jgi:hypothetical protein